MPWIAGAIAVTGLYSAHTAGEAAEEAGELQSEAAQAAAAESGRQFDITQEQAAPFREAGLGALKEQQAMLGLLGPEAQREVMASLEESPAQQFIRNRAQRALLRNQAAIGGLGGGNIRTALQQQATGFAQQDIQNQFNRLGTLTGGGQAATTNVAQLGQQAAGQIGQYGMQAAQAQASGILGAQQANQAMLGNLVTAGATYYGSRNPYRSTGPIGVAGVGA